MAIRSALYEFFYVLTGALAVFALLETAWPGLVSAYINYNYLLIFWLINAILIMLFKARKI